MSPSDVIADLASLLPQAKRTNSKRILEAELTRLQRLAEGPAPSAPSKPAAPLKTEAAAPAGPSFSTISKYAWDQGKKWVKIYITIAGIDKVPDANVALDVKSTSLRFDVVGLPSPPANLRLGVACLHSAVDVGQCTWARKADSMVLIKLRKAADDDEWKSLDDSAHLEAKRKEEKVAGNKGKSTAQMISEMYAEADEEGKAQLEAAWETGRQKREANKNGPEQGKLV